MDESYAPSFDLLENSVLLNEHFQSLKIIRNILYYMGYWENNYHNNDILNKMNRRREYNTTIEIIIDYIKEYISSPRFYIFITISLIIISPWIMFFVSLAIPSLSSYSALNSDFSFPFGLFNLLSIITYILGFLYFQTSHFYDLLNTMFVLKENSVKNIKRASKMHPSNNSKITQMQSTNTRDIAANNQPPPHIRKKSSNFYLEPPITKMSPIKSRRTSLSVGAGTISSPIKRPANIVGSINSPKLTRIVEEESNSDNSYSILVGDPTNIIIDPVEIEDDEFNWDDCLDAKLLEKLSKELLIWWAVTVIISVACLILAISIHSHAWDYTRPFTSFWLLIQRIVCIAQNSFLGLFFSFVCQLHGFDVDRHAGFYKKELNINQLYLQTHVGARDDMKSFVTFMFEDFLRIAKFTRITSKAFRRMFAFNIVLSLLQALLTMYLATQEATNSRDYLSEILWLLIPSLAYLFQTIGCMFAAAKVNHKYLAIVRLSSEYVCRVKLTSSGEAFPASLGIVPENPIVDNSSSTTNDVLYFQNLTSSLAELVIHRSVGISLYGIVLNRNFFFTISSPMAAYIFFVIQRRIQVAT